MHVFQFIRLILKKKTLTSELVNGPYFPNVIA